jgi:hypothetical protein
MWLIQIFKPLLELAICKEYLMTRKTTGSGTSRRSKKSPASAKPLAPQAVPSARKNVIPINLDDEIRRRAYEIYLERGSTPGNEHDDWVLAERQVRERYQQQTA